MTMHSGCFYYFYSKYSLYEKITSYTVGQRNCMANGTGSDKIRPILNMQLIADRIRSRKASVDTKISGTTTTPYMTIGRSHF